MLVHHHTILTGNVSRPATDITCPNLEAFLERLVRGIDMQKLFKPIAIRGKHGFTGIVGIVTSHIAFHYFPNNSSLQLDVYSCKKYDLKKLLRDINAFWCMEKAEVLFIKRAFDGKSTARLQRYTYEQQRLIATKSGRV